MPPRLHSVIDPSTPFQPAIIQNTGNMISIWSLRCCRRSMLYGSFIGAERTTKERKKKNIVLTSEKSTNPPFHMPMLHWDRWRIVGVEPNIVLIGLGNSQFRKSSWKVASFLNRCIYSESLETRRKTICTTTSLFRPIRLRATKSANCCLLWQHVSSTVLRFAAWTSVPDLIEERSLFAILCDYRTAVIGTNR